MILVIYIYLIIYFSNINKIYNRFDMIVIILCNSVIIKYKHLTEL
jgi:hypothetical protein